MSDLIISVVSVSGDGCYHLPLVRLSLCEHTIMGRYSVHSKSSLDRVLGLADRRNVGMRFPGN